MSIRIMTAVWDIQLPDSEKIVLLALADNASDEGLCWPSIATICRKTCKSERTVQGCIGRLVAAGHLSRDEVAGKGCKYIVHPRRDCTPAETAPPQPLRDTPAAAAPKPSMNHQTSGSKEPSVKRATRLPDDFIAPPAWIDWAMSKRRWGRSQAMEEAECFTNYWQAKPGAQARKLDWEKTWRNWVINSNRKVETSAPRIPI